MPVELIESGTDALAAEAGEGTSIQWLVDNASAYDAFLAAVRRARHSIRLSQLAFDADCVAYSDGGAPTPLLGEMIAAHKARNVDVRILLNESLLLDTATPLRRVLRDQDAATIEVRGVSRFPQLLHAKMLVVDDEEAFLIGSPFANGYWDDSAHRPTDVRRPDRELGGRPVHDLSVRIGGSCARQLAEEFDEWWGCVAEVPADAEDICWRQMAEPGSSREDIRVATTMPRGVHALRPEGRTDVLDAFTDAIDRAESLIYIEHQYMSCRIILDALSRALKRCPELEIIALLNQNPDVTAYRGWQNLRLREYGLLGHPRAGLFTLWTREATPGHAWAVNQVFVHSKALIIDSAWASAGSANIDGVSLHSYGADFASALGRRIFRDVRNIDVNIVVDGSAPDSVEAIQRLQETLWREHLHVDVDLSSPPAGGWLASWRMAATQNIAALNRMTGEQRDGTFVLPYSVASRPIRQLEALGVETEEIDIRFNPSWLEVHCSPNWIRNMFA